MNGTKSPKKMKKIQYNRAARKILGYECALAIRRALVQVCSLASTGDTRQLLCSPLTGLPKPVSALRSTVVRRELSTEEGLHGCEHLDGAGVGTLLCEELLRASRMHSVQ